MAKLDDIINDTPDTNYDPELAMSARFEQAQKSVDWGNHPLFNLADANKASRNPVNKVYGVEDLENITSDMGTIAWDTFRKGVLDLNSVGDKAQMALGNTLAGISGDTIGTEMRDRAADHLMKTMEDSRFIDSNYGDADTWTARFVGGAMSMGEMLAVGALTGPVGLGAYVGTLSLSDGALNDMVKYQEENGNLDGYETDPINLALDYGNAVFQVASELMLGTGRLVNGKFLKAGKTTSAIAKETLDNFIQESLQGAASDAVEVLKGNEDIDILKENVVGYIKDGVVAGVLGGAIGGSAYKLNKNRALAGLDKINKKLHPEMNDKEIRKTSEDVFEKTEQAMNKSFAPELIAHTEAVNDKGKIRDNVRQKVEMMYRDNEDMSEKEKATAIEATTTTELENMLYDSIEKKIPLTAHPLLQGEVNELGWFRDGIPENRRAEINTLNDEIRELKQQKVEATEQKDYNKLDEIETKIEEFRKNLPSKLRDLVIADREEIKNMLDEQRKAVENSQAKKRLFAKAKQMARSAIEKQEKQDTKLAEQIATGAEKARAKREQAETKQQTKEAKIRSLQEQRQIASSIKRLKTKIANKTETPMQTEIDTGDTGYGMLKGAGYTDAQIQKMSYKEMTDKLEELAKQQPVVMNQEQFDLADENARLDDIYPAYDGETIEVDGKERTVYNSNGDRIAKSKEALTNFWRWFGDSKVVDEQGRPLVVYHQTSETFNTFERGRDKAGKYDYETPGGFFFKSSDRNIGIAGNIQMPVYLKAEKTITFDNRQQLQKYWSENIDGYADLLKQYQNVDTDYNARVDNIESDMDKAIDDLENSESYKNATDAQQYQMRSDLMDSFDSTALFDEWRNAANKIAEQMKQLVNDYVSANNIEMVKLENDSGAIGKKTTDSFIVFNSTQIKSVDNRGTYSSDTGNIYKQSKADKAGGKDFRGAYIPEYRFITMTENMDASTLAHELAHDWGQEYFRWARSGKASDSFMKSWGAVERAIGITDKDTYFTYDASEKFARAYEGWLMERQDWAKILNIKNDEEKKAVEDAMEDYRQELVDIYDSLTNPYFTMAWGKTGELKPELKEWFERSTKFDSLDEQVRRGEITAEQASEEKLKDMLETATNNSVENMSEEDKKAVRTIENLDKLETQTKETANRFETEGGNRNAIQARLNQIALAKDITANNAVLDRYDSHRDMLEVAKSADEFVRNRREDAIKIINGEMAEQDGLFASDLYTALERVAKQTGDFDLIEELRHSKVATDLAKELGQRVAGFRNYTGNGEVDIVSALKKVDKIYEKAYNEIAKDEMSADLQAWAEDLQAVDSLADAKLDEFFKDMECQ